MRPADPVGPRIRPAKIPGVSAPPTLPAAATLRRTPRRRIAASAAIAYLPAVLAAAALGAPASDAAPRQPHAHSAGGPYTVSIPPDQLSVAEELGPDIVTALVARDGARLALRVTTLSGLEQPVDLAVSLAHATTTGHCGTGCRVVSLPASTQDLVIAARIAGSSYTTTLPIAFEPAGAAQARSLLDSVDRGQTRLASAELTQSLASSPSVPELTRFQIQAPDRFAYQLSLAGRSEGATTIIGTQEWSLLPGAKLWQHSSYGTGQPFSASGYLDWWASAAGSPRLMDLYRQGSTRYADIAAESEIPDLGPVWFRLHVDVTHERLLRLGMITADHFMTQTWGPFNAAVHIAPPPAHDIAGASG
jgi:hypothetical protein